jgi:CheY-like chemotaxis protein
MSIRARRAASPFSNRPRNTALTIRQLKGSDSLRRFGNFSASAFDDVLEFNIHGLCHSQHGFQCGISVAIFDIGNHLRRKAGLLGNEVFGELAAFPFRLEQGDRLHANGLGLSIHAQGIQKKSVDNTFHYGEIVRVVMQNCVEIQVVPPATGKARILVVDDQIAVAMMIVFLLTRAGCQAEAALNAEQALRRAQTGPFDLISLDIGMPVNGFELCQRLKQIPHLKETPVIFVSGNISEEDQQRAFLLGAVDYITKPFDAQKFVPRILSHVTRKASTAYMGSAVPTES